MRQWGNAALMYANENHGYLPRRGQGGFQPTVQVDRPAGLGFQRAAADVFIRRRIRSWFAGRAPSRVREGRAIGVGLCPEAGDFPGNYYWSYGMKHGGSPSNRARRNNGHAGNKFFTSMGLLIDSGAVFRRCRPGNYCSVFPFADFANGLQTQCRGTNTVGECPVFLGRTRLVDGGAIIWAWVFGPCRSIRT